MSHDVSDCRQPVCYRAALSQVPTGCRHSETSRQNGLSSRTLSPPRARPREPLQIQITRAVVQASTELLESPVDSEFFEVSINTVGPRQKLFSAVHTPWAEMSPQLFKCARPHFLILHSYAILRGSICQSLYEYLMHYYKQVPIYQWFEMKQHHRWPATIAQLSSTRPPEYADWRNDKWRKAGDSTVRRMTAVSNL